MQMRPDADSARVTAFCVNSKPARPRDPEPQGDEASVEKEPSHERDNGEM